MVSKQSLTLLFMQSGSRKQIRTIKCRITEGTQFLDVQLHVYGCFQ